MRWLLAALLLAGCLEAPPASESPGEGGPCGTLRALRDDFESSIDPARWTASNVGVSGGVASLTCEPGGPNAVLDSAAFYRLAGGQLAIDLDASQMGSGVLELSLADPAGSALVVRVENGGLTVFSAPAGGGVRTLVAQTFSAEQHMWRVREEGGALYWATATTEGAGMSEDGPFTVGLGPLVRFEMVLEPGDAANAISIAAINLDESEPHCSAASLMDDFTELDPRWQLDAQGDCEIDAAGQVVLGYSAQAFCALTTVERFDLRDSAYAVKLADVGDCAPEPVMQVRLGNDSAFELLCDDDAGSRRLIARSDDGDISNIEFDAAKHRYIRVHHDGRDQELAFEASPGDGTWSQVGVTRMDDPQPLARTSLRFYLGGETSGGFESVAFDSLGLAP